MSRGMTVFLTPFAVYLVAQLTIGEMLANRIAAFGQEIEAAPRGPDGALGPVDLRSSDICSLLIFADQTRGTVARWAFPRAGMAAGELTARYRFTSSDRCSKYSYHHMITAHPIDQTPG